MINSIKPIRNKRKSFFLIVKRKQAFNYFISQRTSAFMLMYFPFNFALKFGIKNIEILLLLFKIGFALPFFSFVLFNFKRYYDTMILCFFCTLSCTSLGCFIPCLVCPVIGMYPV